MSEEPEGGASEEQYRLLAESFPHPVWVARPDGSTEYWNGRYGEYAGVSLTEARVSGWQRVIHPDDLPATLLGWDRSLGSGEPFYGEHRIRRADGTYRWHATRAVPLRDRQGRIVRWLGTSTDIEEWKAAEEALRASEGRFRAIIEKSFDAVILLAADGTLLYASPSCCRVLGHRPVELVGRDAFDLVHPDDRPEVARLFAGMVRTPGDNDGTTHRALHRDGSWRWLETRGTNLLDDPAVRAVVINFRDITEQKLAQDAKARDALLLANVRDSVIVTDLEGVVTYWNEGATRLFGWTAEEMLGRPSTNRVPEAARPPMAEKTRAIAGGGGVRRGAGGLPPGRLARLD
jgi:PAS domain S-box-containing protein